MAARREVEKVNAERRKRIIDVDAAAELERKRRTMADSVKRRADDDAMGKLRKNARKLAIISMATEQKERSLVYFADRAKWDAIERNERQEQVRLARQYVVQKMFICSILLLDIFDFVQIVRARASCSDFCIAAVFFDLVAHRTTATPVESITSIDFPTMSR
jgi:hypothetical protein